jgi:starch-binding outer membrane protein, SusD/RagB family
MRYKKILFILLALGSLFSCTKLDEELRDNVTFDQAQTITDPISLLKASYDGLNDAYVNQDNVWALSEFPTDEAIPPTRGKDWDDNGVWRVFHTHTWDANNAKVLSSFNALLKIVYNATNTLNFNPPPGAAAEAIFLRAFAMFSVVDLYGQVPYRVPGGDLLKAPEVLTAAQALDTIITQVTAIIPTLPDGPATVANKDAARVLLMKCYLNKGTLLNRESPTFDVADMNQVITLADAVTASPRDYSLTPNFYDNFAPLNGTLSKENIFTLIGGPGTRGSRTGNSVIKNWHATMHYNMKPSGWNGFTTLAEMYDKFGATDKRLSDSYTGFTNVTGTKVGLLIGQQFDQNGAKLKDGLGNDLFFTKEVTLIASGPTLETSGVRVLKYAPDLANDNDDANNDYVFFRYADVLLMKAEAILRGGTGSPDAKTLVNEVRSRANALPLATVTLTDILDERAREFLWESYRRLDSQRFGKFLEARPPNKPTVSDKKYLLYPIPTNALAVNPNLTQNPGYGQ